jgi:hypothetical protein
MSAEEFPLTTPASQSVHSGVPAIGVADVYPPDLAVHTIHWLLRFACACIFIGHGAFGLITKPVWVSYFAVVGIPPATAYLLMPVIGTIDIALGILAFFKPLRAVLLYMVFWSLLTATIRPLAGEPLWEFIERTPNWGVPLAFLLLRGLGELPKLRDPRQWGTALKTWFQ